MFNTMNTAPALMRLEEVCKMLGICRTTLWKLQRDNPNFPKPLQITSRKKAYRRSDIERFINDDKNLCFS